MTDHFYNLLSCSVLCTEQSVHSLTWHTGSFKKVHHLSFHISPPTDPNALSAPFILGNPSQTCVVAFT